MKNISKGQFLRIEIPLPPIEVQRNIVVEIEGYQKVIDGARAVVEHYRPHIAVDPSWPLDELGEIAELQAGFASGKSEESDVGVPHIRPMNITESGRFTCEGLKRISEEEFRPNSSKTLVTGDVLFNNTNSAELVGKTAIIPIDIQGGYSNHMTRIRVMQSKVEPQFLATILHNMWRSGQFMSLATRWIGQAGINTKTLASVLVPVPRLDTQREIVAEIQAEQQIVDGNKQLIDQMQRKIDAAINRVWGEAPAPSQAAD